MKKKLIEFNRPINGRYYDINSCDWNDIIDKSKNGLMLGELNHSSSNSYIDLKSVSHVINNIQLFQDGIFGEIKVLDTPNGKALQELINNGFHIGYSARLIGNMDNNGKITNAKIIAFDAVQVPYDISYIRMKKLSKIKDIIDEKRSNR